MRKRAHPFVTRDVLLTLNAAADLPREAVCRLAKDLPLWLDASGDPVLLARTLGLPAPVLGRALELRQRAARVAGEELRKAEALGIAVVTREESGYPPALHDLPLPPPVIFVRGELPERPSIAIVGSRRMDPYGREVATLFARQLAASGLAIVSGFAHGVDATAHRAAIGVPEGRTVAVLGCGHGVDYPRGHRRLGDEIASAGALVSEFPCGREPTTWGFPVRNRIIAALSHGVLIVQAACRSGSLITARLALELGREVYAVPGRIFDDKAIGPNTLLRDGAALVQHPNDILEGLPASIRGQLRLETAPPAERPPSLPGLQGRLVQVMRPGEPLSPEDLAARLDTRLDEVLAVLLELELMGRVRRYPGPAYGGCA
jgi:DNA processing protein